MKEFIDDLLASAREKAKRLYGTNDIELSGGKEHWEDCLSIYIDSNLISVMLYFNVGENTHVVGYKVRGDVVSIFS